MVSHRDVIKYLVAAKSFYSQVGEGEFVIIDDGTLTRQDRSTIACHLGTENFLEISDLETGACPKGGTWERLLLILDLIRDHYVVQLDSDTLTTGPVAEVLDCIRANQCFTLGTANGQRFVTLSTASKVAEKFTRDHVQIASEKNFKFLPDPDRRFYVRGSSGFAGFARGLQLRDTVMDFSRRMQELIGARWNEWGSEQVASNYLVANTPSANVLPHPKYTCFGRGQPLDESVFVHFIGTDRYYQGVYGTQSRKFLRSLA